MSIFVLPTIETDDYTYFINTVVFFQSDSIEQLYCDLLERFEKEINDIFSKHGHKKDFSMDYFNRDIEFKFQDRIETIPLSFYLVHDSPENIEKPKPDNIRVCLDQLITMEDYINKSFVTV